MRVLSGIQPTGPIHWGNYFGAIRQYIDLQNNDQAFYFIANLHALTSVRDAGNLKKWTLDAAIDLLALGLDPSKATLFVQSDVPEVSELCWLLMTGAPMGLLERCHAYKDKKAKGLTADAGLFTYPVLQAADILAYDSDTVPVGEDQVQHIEVCRDLAGSFNHEFGEAFVMPKAYVLETSARVPGTDGEKMSKSYNNTLAVFEDAKAQRKQIMRIVTDSRPMDEAKEPAGDVLYDLYSLVAADADRDAMAALYRRGGFGYGEVKKALADAAEKFWAEPRARRAELATDPKRIYEVLGDGAAVARKKAGEVLKRAQNACGIKGYQMQIVITAVGPDNRGLADPIVHSVTGLGANIAEIQMYDHDQESVFSMLTRVDVDPARLDELRQAMVEVSNTTKLSIRTWTPEITGRRPRLAICVTYRPEPALALLRAIRDGHVKADAQLMMGNRDTCRGLAEQFDVPWFNVATKTGKASGTPDDERMVALWDEHEVDFVVLARYMRILPATSCWKYAGGRIINLHHGLLPSFPGMQPYHDAFASRMLTYGATCHFIVPELDAGCQIIYQSTFMVPPGTSRDEIIRRGQADNEPHCLVEGARRVVEGEVQLHFNRVVARR